MISVPYTIKDLYHQDHCYKNIRIHFPNGERSDICNNLIVKDSVSFTESLCSQNQLKFGLCESPIFECEVVGVGNIKGAKIEVSVEIECPFSASGAEWKADLQKYVYSIPYGTFVVDSCQRQADMNHRKIVAYNEIATKEWEVSPIEYAKINFGATYTPNMGYFFGGNGVPMVKTLCDETVNDWSKSTYTKTYPIRHSSGVLFEKWTVTVERYYRGWNTEAGSNAIYIFDINSDTMQREKEIREKLQQISANNEFTEDMASEVKALALPHFCSFRDNGGGDYSGQNFYTFGIFKHIYPYINNFYENSSYTTRTYYQVPEKYVAVRSQFVNNTWVTRQRIEINLNVWGEKKYHSYVYKNAYSYLNNYAYSFEMIQKTIGTKTAYVPVIEEFDVNKEAESYVNLFGMMTAFDRIGEARMVSLKRLFNLVPESDLYPGDNVYPEGTTGGLLYPHEYESCWYDDSYTMEFGKVQCTYKDTNNVETFYEYYLAGYDSDTDPNSYQVYDLTNNEKIKTSKWTQSQIETFCEIIASNIEGVSYMPVEFKGLGLPYVEAGDTFEILTRSSDSITTIVLNRTLTGEMTLKDTYKSV